MKLKGGCEMKKLLVMIMVLGLATVANAQLKISVGGFIDPPDTEVTLMPSETIVIDVWSDGTLMAPDGGTYMKLDGPGTLDITLAINSLIPPGFPSSIYIADWDPYVGMVFMDLMVMEVPRVPIPVGVMIDNIIFHCEGLEDVVITLFGDDGAGTIEVYDTQVIHQPEPITIALLGLGGLFLRRRK
jgi:hypothetical protein